MDTATQDAGGKRAPYHVITTGAKGRDLTGVARAGRGKGRDRGSRVRRGQGRGPRPTFYDRTGPTVFTCKVTVAVGKLKKGTKGGRIGAAFFSAMPVPAIPVDKTSAAQEGGLPRSASPARGIPVSDLVSPVAPKAGNTRVGEDHTSRKGRHQGRNYAIPAGKVYAAKDGRFQGRGQVLNADRQDQACFRACIDFIRRADVGGHPVRQRTPFPENGVVVPANVQVGKQTALGRKGRQRQRRKRRQGGRSAVVRLPTYSS